ncbi:MAG: inositol monophosphatase [Alphaproteobacteria bacterium]|nr:inositol monophosphatase [Alphaproteobacteria bacterium]
MAIRSALITVMERAVEKAAKGLRRDFGEVEHLQISRKGPGDFVSNADLKAQEILRAELNRARPEFGFILEEGDEKQTDKPFRWIIDPLDGTTNFLHAVPHWAISVAAAQGDQLLAGMVYNPISDEMFWAERGVGAYCNHQRLRVSARKDLSECLIATGIPFKGHDIPDFMPQLSRLAPQVAGTRRFGSAALDLAFVAAGRFDGYWESGVNSWDIAAGLLLVSEAGGKITSLKPNVAPLASGALLASNQNIHDPLLKIIKG